MGIFFLSNIARSETKYRSEKDKQGGTTYATDLTFEPLLIQVLRNSFKFIFCSEGCIYTIE